MRESDQQHGKPARLYQNTKANIVALGLGAGDEGCMAYATDTNEFGTFDGAAWAWSNHALLSSRHYDTVANAPTRGSMIVGSAAPAWDEVVHPGIARHLQTNVNDVVWAQSITMADNTWIGIGVAAERIVFDTAGDITVMGAKFGVNVAVPTYMLDILDDNPGGYVSRFYNDGDNVNRHGIYVQCGDDNGAAVGNTIYFAAKDGDGDWTGQLKTIDGVFQLLDVSDGRLKTNIVDTKLNGLDIINELQVRDYNWKANPDGPAMTSFVAQEAQEAFPVMVSSTEGLLMTSRAMLIPILAKAIQELDARLTDLGG